MPDYISFITENEEDEAGDVYKFNARFSQKTEYAADKIRF